MAWLAVFYTPIYFIFLSHLNLLLTGIVPGNDVAKVCGSPTSGVDWCTLLGLLAFEPNLAQFWLPIVVLSCLTICSPGEG